MTRTGTARVALAALAVAAVAVSTSAGERAGVEQEPAPLFRSVVDVVTIDAFAHQNRQPIAGLTAADFLVLDNGVEQSVESIGTTDSAHVIVGLDLSGSVDGDVLERMRAAVRAVIGQITPDDRLSLFTFADRLRVLARAEKPDGRLDRLIDDLRATGSTTLHDALVLGSVLSTTDARPAVFLLFTDGEDTTSWSTVPRVVDVLRRTDVVVYPVGGGLPSATMAMPESLYLHHHTWLAPTDGDMLRLLQLVADTTGGEFLRVQRNDTLSDTFAAILAQYRQRYLLSFVPTGVGHEGWHRLEVRLRKRPGAVVAREGYMARSQ